MPKTLLAIFAHPDDESFGPGGTLAKYAAEGVDVHIAIATDGAAGSMAEGHEVEREQLASVRSKELEAAVKILGGTLHRLGYRDSGMKGDPANDDPQAWIRADEEEAVRRVVQLIRELRPHIIITHDETGGYFHPDHIQCWNITTKAFHAAADPSAFPHIGPAPHQPERLYYSAFPNRWVKFFVFLMRLRGMDPRKMGRNKDIDFTRLGLPGAKVHTRINYRPYWDIKGLASAQHKTQGGGVGFNRWMPLWMQKWLFGRETFMRAYPPVPDGYREEDLFA
ncbi:MAG: PIG-L family deacetylase [Chloroflexi bacterium]|nr:PIG-L family deacetylase [Chloroflexota bacterium]MBP8059322.1 PIG-L family deacetylase [Chloroflexota bacterium]